MTHRGKLVWYTGIGAVVAGAALTAAFLVGRATAPSSTGIEGTITLSSYDGTEGCVQPAQGGQVCGAFVNKEGGGNSLFAVGRHVTGSVGTISTGGTTRQILLLVPVSN